MFSWKYISTVYFSIEHGGNIRLTSGLGEGYGNVNNLSLKFDNQLKCYGVTRKRNQCDTLASKLAAGVTFCVPGGLPGSKLTDLLRVTTKKNWENRLICGVLPSY